ncbi:aminopeptidase N-like [Ptychodera flava]|uniref:aminopeptidase N-like n=1 Tax=Ptychodera flava TaxID=63121 RepID=UPI00396A82D8
MVAVRAGLLDTNRALSVTLYLDRENDYLPWMAAIKGFNYIRKRMYTTEPYGLLQNYIKQKVGHLVNILGWGVGDNYGTLGSKGNLQQRFLRTLTLKTLCENGDAEAVSQAVTLFDNWLNKDEEIPADLKSFVYFVGVMKGDSEVWDTVWRRQEVSSHADDAHALRQALAASQYPWVLWRFASLVFGFGEMIQGVTSLINNKSQMKQLEQLFSQNPPGGSGDKSARWPSNKSASTWLGGNAMKRSGTVPEREFIKLK